MSFVLEALKKQQAGQDPDAAVSLARQSLARRRQRIWAGLFAVAAAVNIGLLAWIFGVPWLQDGSPPAGGVSGPREPAVQSQPGAGATPATATAGNGTVTSPAPDTAAGSDPGPAAAPATDPPGAPAARQERAPVPEPAATDAPASATPEPAEELAGEPAGPRLVDLQDLPTAARARFPGIAFSTHIFAEDADLRAIVANGQRLQEGDEIRGLEIVAITEDGVVLAFEDYHVAVPMATDW